MVKWLDMTDDDLRTWILKNRFDTVRDLLPHYGNDEHDTLNAILNDMNENPMYTEGFNFEV